MLWILIFSLLYGFWFVFFSGDLGWNIHCGLCFCMGCMGSWLECGLWNVVFSGSLQLCVQGMWFVDCVFVWEVFGWWILGMWIVECVFFGKSSTVCPGNVVCGLCFFWEVFGWWVLGMWFVDCVFFPEVFRTIQGPQPKTFPKNHNPQTTFPGCTAEDFHKKPQSTIHIPRTHQPKTSPENHNPQTTFQGPTSQRLPQKTTIHNPHSNQDPRKKTQSTFQPSPLKGSWHHSPDKTPTNNHNPQSTFQPRPQKRKTKT